MRDDAAIIPDVFVADGHADIEEDVLAIGVGEDSNEHLPRMQVGVALEEVVETAIAGDFELWADAEGGAGLFGEADAFDDALGVAFEVERPLVQGTERVSGGRGRGARGGTR